MSENTFNVGDRVTIMRDRWPIAITTVKKVHKNGNFITAARPGTQFRQSGFRAGDDLWRRSDHVVRFVPEHTDAIALGRLQHEARDLLDKAAARFRGQRDSTTAEEVAALNAALRAFVTPKES